MAAEKTIRQPVRDAPVSQNGERPPLDWGDEERDEYWEDLYNKGLINPPYRSAQEQHAFWRSFLAEFEPVGKPMSDDELMCALGRCACERCE